MVTMLIYVHLKRPNQLCFVHFVFLWIVLYQGDKLSVCKYCKWNLVTPIPSKYTYAQTAMFFEVLFRSHGVGTLLDTSSSSSGR